MSDKSGGITGAEACANIEESKRSGVLKAMAESGVRAREVLSAAGITAYNRPSEKCPECGWQMRPSGEGSHTCDICHLTVEQ